MVVACVTVNDVKILNLLEMMLCCISSVDACNTWVETTTKDSCETSLLEAVAISPLPRVLKVSLILWLVVGCIKIVASASQAGIHNCQILIGQGKVYYQLWLEVVEQCLKLFNIISINLSCLYVHIISCLVDILHNLIAFCLATASNHKLCKYVCILSNLKCCNGSHATCSNH